MTQPRQVLLFAGHRVDAPGREPPRFPPAMVPAATRAIATALEAAGAGPADLALTQGASGGDLIFTECCQALGARVMWMQPLPEADFIDECVLTSAGGPAWLERYLAARSRMVLPGDAPRTMQSEVGPLPEGTDVWVRCNRWLLDTALAFGTDKLRFLCLWDGGEGDNPGGTKHLRDEVLRRSGRAVWVDTRRL